MTVFESKLTASDAASLDYFGASASVDGVTAIVGAPEHLGISPAGSGSAYVFVRSGTLWNEQAKLIPSDGEAGDRFGYSVAISGDTAVVGALRSGAAYIFVQSGGVWTEQAKLTASDGMASDYFGSSVAIHGDTVVVGAPSPFAGSLAPGAAYVFVRSGAVWSEQEKLTASDGVMEDRFGHSVAIDADIAIVGAQRNDEAGTDAGAAYAFVRTGTVWSEEQKLTASDAASYDLFGDSVSLSGNTAVVGAVNDDDKGIDSGSAYVFVRTATGWSAQQKLTASDGAAGDRFGISTSLDGDIAVIGSFLYDTPVPGASSDTYAYVFERNEDDWTEKAKLITGSGSSIVGAEAQFVGVSGCTVIVGTELDDDRAMDAGAAYVYTLDSGTCPCTEPPPNLVSWWPLDELAGPRSDDSANSNHGDWVDAPIPVPGVVDGALQFDGIHSYVEVPNDPSLNFGTERDFTIDAWIKPLSIGKSPQGGIVDKRDTITGRGYSLGLVDGYLAFVISDGSSASMSFVATDLMPVGSWSFVAVTVNRAADEGKVYINGALEGTFNASDTASGTIDNTQPLFIAKSSEDEFFYGVIDEVEIFDRALEPTEIVQIHEAFTGGKCKPCVHPDGMVSWWPFDETGGPLSADIFGPHDGNQVGGPTPAIGKVDVSLAFNGIDQHVKVADHDSLNFGISDSFSIDAWVRPEAADSKGVIVDKLDPSTGVGYRLFILNQTLMFTISDGSGSPFSYISPNLIEPVPSWFFIAVTVDRELDVGTVYVNNAIDGHFTPSDTALSSISNTWPLFMGGNLSGDNFRGRLDEVEIFNKVLTLDEINKIYIADLEGKCKPGFDLI